MPVAVVLLSGGLDSATCLAWAIREGFTAHALTVRYGQRHAAEVERAAVLARAVGAASHRVVDIELSFLAGSALTDRGVEVPKHRADGAIGAGIPVTYVPARNLLFLSIAVAWAESLGASDVVIGVNAVDYSGYPDCRPEFVRAFESAAALGTRSGSEGGAWRVHAPLAGRSKAEIVRLAASWGVPYHETLSCYDPGPAGQPCGACDACILRARGFEAAGLPDGPPA